MSAKRGVISLIPKKKSDPLDLKGYRPLMLLNTDHKIITKMVTNRLKPLLHKVIDKQQTGYVPGRFIGTNLRKLIDILLYLEKTEQTGLLLQLDYYKCFDSVDHDALIGSLRYFKVGEEIIKWVLMLYNGFEFCVINNGKWSEYYPQGRGVHQGSALSGPLFLFVAEILAINIKSNSRIEGLEILGEEEKISQYADDTNITSAYKESSINEVIKELNTFYDNTGLKVNYDKSVIFKIGCTKQKCKRLYLDKKFVWGKGTIDVLGLLITTDSSQMQEQLNLAKILEKACGVMETWHNRHLSLIGKVEIVNTLVNSLFVYKMQVLPCLTNEFEGKLNRIISRFIWNGRKPKIKLEFLQLNTKQGGRKLSNISLRDKTLKIEWIRRLHSDEGDTTITKLAYFMINTEITNELFWECNFSPQDVEQFKIISRFWCSVVQSWAHYNFHTPKGEAQCSNQIIWYNSHVKVKGRLIFLSNWYEKGIIYIKDLVCEGQIMTHAQICEIYDMYIPHLQYNAVISAIPRQWKKFVCKCSQEGEIPEFVSKYSLLTSYCKWSKHVYDALNTSEVAIHKCKNIWSSKLDLIVTEDEMQNCFRNINKHTHVTKYRAFQFRLLHNAIFLNDRLKYLNISPNSLCSNCNDHKENYLHFFYQCSFANNILGKLIEYLVANEYTNLDELNVTAQTVLFNNVHDSAFNVANTLVGIFKQNLYAHKCLGKKITTEKVISEFEFIHKLEQRKAIQSLKCRNYNARWPDKIDIQEICQNIPLDK